MIDEKKREEILAHARKKAEEWFNDPDFDRQFEESMRQVQDTMDHIRETQRVNMVELLRPFDF